MEAQEYRTRGKKNHHINQKRKIDDSSLNILVLQYYSDCVPIYILSHTRLIAINIYSLNTQMYIE